MGQIAISIETQCDTNYSSNTRSKSNGTESVWEGGCDEEGGEGEGAARGSEGEATRATQEGELLNLHIQSAQAGTLLHQAIFLL